MFGTLRFRRFPLLRSRLGLAIRIVSASIGGYLLAVAMAFAVARMLPASRVEAVTTASLVAILMMPLAAIWAFAARRAWMAFVGIAGLTLILALLAWVSGPPA